MGQIEGGGRSFLLHGEAKRPSFNPELRILPTAEAVDLAAATIFIEQIQKKSASVITTMTGSTPVGMYQLLVEAYERGEVDFSEIKLRNLDEYWPLDPQFSDSYKSFMQRNLVGRTNVNPESWEIPNGYAEDPYEEARRFSLVIAADKPDIAFVGIGPGETCHIAFNERGTKIDEPTRLVNLDEQTQRANFVHFENPINVRDTAITQGFPEILSADHIVLLAKGQGKAWGIHRSLLGPIDSEAPASFLRYHPKVTMLLDMQAASLLPNHLLPVM